MVYKYYLKIVCLLLHPNYKGIYFLSNMYQLSLNQPVILQKDGRAWKDENCVDNFAANLTNRDLCLHDLNITLRIPLFNKIHSFIYWSYFIYYVHSWKKDIYVSFSVGILCTLITILIDITFSIMLKKLLSS